MYIPYNYNSEANNKTKKKVVFFVSDTNAGGVETIQLNIAKNLNRDRFFTIVVTSGSGEVAKKLGKYADEYHNLGVGSFPKLKSYKNGKYNESYISWITLFVWIFKCIFLFVKWLSFNNIDIIHSHILHYNIIAGISGKILGIPSIWHIHNPQKKTLRHGGPFLFEGYLASIFATEFIAVSKYTAKSFHHSWKYKTNIISNSISFNNRKAIQKQGYLKKIINYKNDQKIVGIVCSIQRRKGLDRFVKVAIRLSLIRNDLIFIVIGPTIGNEGKDLLNELKANITTHNLAEKIIFLGNIKNVKYKISDIDVFFMCSYPGTETFGLVVIEAMAAGVPVVAFNNDAIPEIIDDSLNGFLIPDNDIEQATYKINKLLSNKKIQQSFSNNAKNKIFQNYNNKKFICKTENLYNKLITK